MKGEEALSEKQLKERRRYQKNNLARRSNPVPDKYITITGKMLNQETLNKIAKEMKII